MLIMDECGYIVAECVMSAETLGTAWRCIEQRIGIKRFGRAGKWHTGALRGGRAVLEGWCSSIASRRESSKGSGSENSGESCCEGARELCVHSGKEGCDGGGEGNGSGEEGIKIGGEECENGERRRGQ